MKVGFNVKISSMAKTINHLEGKLVEKRRDSEKERRLIAQTNARNAELLALIEAKQAEEEELKKRAKEGSTKKALATWKQPRVSLVHAEGTRGAEVLQRIKRKAFLSCHAVKIQKCIRGHLARQLRVGLIVQRAAHKLQAAARRKLAVRLAERMCLDRAATSVSLIYRMRKALKAVRRRRTLARVNDMVILDSEFREWSRQTLRLKTRWVSATVIQSFWRKIIFRFLTEKVRRQTLWRAQAVLGRAFIRFRRNRQIRIARRPPSALKIQCQVRRWLAARVAEVIRERLRRIKRFEEQWAYMPRLCTPQGAPRSRLLTSFRHKADSELANSVLERTCTCCSRVAKDLSHHIEKTCPGSREKARNGSDPKVAGNVWQEMKTYASGNGRLRVLEVFQKVDKDRDGCISPVEFISACTQMGITGVSTGIAKHVFSLVSKNSGDKLEYFELLGNLQEMDWGSMQTRWQKRKLKKMGSETSRSPPRRPRSARAYGAREKSGARNRPTSAHKHAEGSGKNVVKNRDTTKRPPFGKYQGKSPEASLIKSPTTVSSSSQPANFYVSLLMRETESSEEEFPLPEAEAHG